MEVPEKPRPSGAGLSNSWGRREHPMAQPVKLKLEDGWMTLTKPDRRDNTRKRAHAHHGVGEDMRVGDIPGAKPILTDWFMRKR